MTEEVWKRPSSAPLRVWRRFSGLKPMPDGKIPQFWIEDAKTEMVDEILDHMSSIFLRDEQISNSLRYVEDEVSMEEFLDLWRKMIVNDQVTLVAMTDWPDGNPRFVGCNVLAVYTKNQTKLNVKGVASKKLFDFMKYLSDKVDVFERFGVDKTLYGWGLSVKPEFRGQNVGLELLKTRTELCAAIGLELTTTVFSGPGSQKQSERAGFEILAEVHYSDYIVDGERVLPNVTWPSAQLKSKYFGKYTG